MRLVAVADTHLFHTELRVPDGDVFIHAGDICRGGTLRELEVAAKWIQSLPHRHKLVVAGNHDWAFAHTFDAAVQKLGAGVTYLQDSGAQLEGLKVWGSPWQPEFNDWAFNLPRGAPLAEKWALIPEGVDLLITHSPPLEIGDGDGTAGGYGGAGRHGCEALRDRVKALKPLLHLFGHIHDSGGFWAIDGTHFANVTTWECERAPTVIDVDLITRAVTPVTVPPARR